MSAPRNMRLTIGSVGLRHGIIGPRNCASARRNESERKKMPLVDGKLALTGGEVKARLFDIHNWSRTEYEHRLRSL